MLEGGSAVKWLSSPLLQNARITATSAKKDLKGDHRGDFWSWTFPRKASLGSQVQQGNSSVVAEASLGMLSLGLFWTTIHSPLLLLRKPQSLPTHSLPTSLPCLQESLKLHFSPLHKKKKDWGQDSRRNSSLLEYIAHTHLLGFPGGASGKESACNAGDVRDASSIPESGRFPWRRAWQSTPVLLPGKSHGQRSLAGYSPQGCSVRHSWSDLTYACTHLLVLPCSLGPQ